MTCDLSVSADGFVTGPDQRLDQPLGRGGERLHGWHVRDVRPEDQQVVEEWMGTCGAHVMGRNMFGPGRGAWDLDWQGWWGPEPPYGVPVFVLTHHEREPLVQGGTTFTFVTDGLASALAQARQAVGDRHVAIAGGAATVNAYLAAGLVDVLRLHVVPEVLGEGERIFTGVPPRSLQVEAMSGNDRVTHLTYRVSGITAE